MYFLIILLLITTMLIHIGGVISGVFIIQKYEDSLQKLSAFSIFNYNNICAHRLWFVILSICVSFAYLIFGAEYLVKVLKTFHVGHLKYILMNTFVGILILQFHFFVLKDRRNPR